MLDLQPGQRIRRVELHARYGGRRQGGISPSTQSDNVFLITAPARGEHYGYIYDGRSNDGFFHYTGEGQVGDQLMTQGNRAVRDHEIEGRELHLFEAHGTELEYIGRFRYHDAYQADAPEVGGTEPDRKVLVFRLEQLEGLATGPIRRRLERLPHEPVVEIPVEQQMTERTLIGGEREEYVAERREQQLVRSFVRYLERGGLEVCRLQIWPDGEPAPMFCDVYEKAANVLYEAKGTVARPAIRMALGQLADYSRFITPAPERVILLPEEPRQDLVALAVSQGVGIVCAQGNEFASVGIELPVSWSA
jgi:hypothetical protein